MWKLAIQGSRRPASALISRRSLLRPTVFRTYAIEKKRGPDDMSHEEYVPEGKIVVDPVTGKKKWVKPMTVNTELPEHPGRAEKKQEWTTFLVFAGLMTIACVGIFQYEKMSSPVMNATMYYLRRSPPAREALGNEITYWGVVPWISGDLNTMKGHIDVHTRVEGDKGKATMYLKAGKENEKIVIEEWKLVVDGDGDGTPAKTIDLKADSGFSLDLNQSQ